MWCYLLTELRLLNILLIIFLCTVKLLKIQASQNQKNIFQWLSCTNKYCWSGENCPPHERTCTQHSNTQTHTHALVNVKVNGPAIGPDSTALYHHRTETTLRLDDLLGSRRPQLEASTRLDMTHHRTQNRCCERGRVCTSVTTQSVMEKQVFLFDCLWSELQNLTKRRQKYTIFCEWNKSWYEQECAPCLQPLKCDICALKCNWTLLHFVLMVKESRF